MVFFGTKPTTTSPHNNSNIHFWNIFSFYFCENIGYSSSSSDRDPVTTVPAFQVKLHVKMHTCIHYIIQELCIFILYTDNIYNIDIHISVNILIHAYSYMYTSIYGQKLWPVVVSLFVLGGMTMILWYGDIGWYYLPMMTTAMPSHARPYSVIGARLIEPN